MPFFDLSAADLPNYKSGVTAAADFDSFWSTTLAETRQHKLDAVFTPFDAGLKLVEVFDARYAGFGGHRIKGWYIVPRGATGRLSVVVKYLGYNGGRGFAHEHLLWPNSGRALFVMDTRGQGSGWSRGDTADPVGSEPQHAGFMTKGIGDPATYFYRRVFADAVRAIEAVRTRAEIDPSKVAVAGGSQGGGIAIAAAALMPDVAALIADVPFLCDFPHAVGLAQRDPYNEISRYLSIQRDKVETVFNTLSYFDGVNMARRGKAQALFSVAAMDVVCPPSTVYGAFNAYGGADKTMVSYTFNDHEGGGPFQERAQLDWLAGRL